MANDTPGLAIARYLVQRGEQIVRLYLHAPKHRKRAQEIRAACPCSDADVFEGRLLKDADHVGGLRALAPDFIITVYWMHLLSGGVLAAPREGTVNLHPALLPTGRGWYPHVHSILNGTPTGVTLHAIDEQADTGPVWAQREVPLTPYDTAYTIYMRQQREIVELFRETWPKIATGQIQPVPQNEKDAIYYPKDAINGLDELHGDAMMTVREVIDRLRARSFGDMGFAFVEEDGQRVYLNLRLSRDIHFGHDDPTRGGEAT